MTVKDVGIIGAGRLGQAMARTALRAGRQVVLANSRGPETLASLVSMLGDGASAGAVEAKSQVRALFEDAGFAVIDLGGLVTGGAMQQLGGPLAGVNLIKLP
jgi:predicted dinucleotide-binding enzyme